MSDPSSRMLRLLSLLQTHRFWAGPELAAELDVSERTLRRDVDRLRELGYPVDAARGAGGGYQLQAGSQLPPLLLDDDDAVAIAVGLRTAAGGSVAGIEETSVRALAKLEQVLPPKLRRRVSALQAAIAPSVGPPSAVDATVLAVIAQACRDQERLRFGYRRRDGEVGDRTVEPHRLVSLQRRWYLAAWDARRQDWRTFRVDRISDPAGSGSRFAPRRPPTGDAVEYVRSSIRSMPARYEAVVTVEAAADAIPREVAWMRGEVEPIDDRSCRIRTRGDSLEWLTLHLAFLQHDYRIEGPPEFLAHVRERSARLARAAAGDGA
ncbi:helix-turn-helix transcriptional regulator [Patulibacter defluvii]|uniref:helix-turn-helix transcriptional regulator n=1 Tax=Patulibacter defluvii TaxID=3095358 RepID=UPI002A762134|nr:YafY family protein [Patulibacter sp. DM4]